MTNVSMSAQEKVEVAEVVQQVTGQVYGIVQQELENLDWTRHLDDDDWATLQQDVIRGILEPVGQE